MSLSEVFTTTDNQQHPLFAFNQEKDLDRGLLRDCETSNFAKVRFQLYWSQITLGRADHFSAAVEQTQRGD